MRIGITCLNINPSYKGGGNTYIFGLLEGFSNIGTKQLFQLYLSPKNMHLFDKFKQFKNFELIVDNYLLVKKIVRRIALYPGNTSFYKTINNFAFNNITKIMDSKSDILYTPTTVLSSFSHKKLTMLSMHDIQQFHYPEFFTKQELLFRRILFQLSAEHATYFQASSNFIKKDLLEHYPNLSEEQIVVIPEGVNIEEFGKAQNTDSLYTQYGIPDKFLFFPAQLWPHKNHITVLKALKKVETEHELKIPLVLTGAQHASAKNIFDFISKNKMDYVFYLGEVPFEDILKLYQKATFLITAVLYESSSLTILEAAASGTPVIASKTPPNEETGQILKLNLFEPMNASELSDLVLSLWYDDITAKKQASYNKDHISYYSWNNAAQKYLDFFEKVLKS